jgi:hypothetical protein
LGPLALGMGGSERARSNQQVYIGSVGGEDNGGPRPHVYSSEGWSRGGTRPQVFSSDKYITEYPIDIKHKYLWYNVK